VATLCSPGAGVCICIPRAGDFAAAATAAHSSGRWSRQMSTSSRPLALPPLSFRPARLPVPVIFVPRDRATATTPVVASQSAQPKRAAALLPLPEPRATWTTTQARPADIRTMRTPKAQPTYGPLKPDRQPQIMQPAPHPHRNRLFLPTHAIELLSRAQIGFALKRRRWLPNPCPRPHPERKKGEENEGKPIMRACGGGGGEGISAWAELNKGKRNTQACGWAEGEVSGCSGARARGCGKARGKKNARVGTRLPTSSS
jgi:hypothetical protein